MGVGDADRRLDHANQDAVIVIGVGVVVPPDAAVLAAAGGAPRDGRVPHLEEDGRVPGSTGAGGPAQEEDGRVRTHFAASCAC